MAEKEKEHWDVTDPPLYREWLKDKFTLAESTIEAYVQAVMAFLQRDPDIEKLEDYNAFIIDKAIKKRSYNFYSAVKKYVQFKISDAGLRQRIIDGMIKPSMPSPKHDRKYIPEQKLVKMLNYLQTPKHRIIALIQMVTGVRAGDVLNLRHGQIYFEEYQGKQTLRLNVTGKRNKRTVVFVHDPLAQRIINTFVNTPRQNTIDDYIFLDKRREGSQRQLDTHKTVAYLKRMNYYWYFFDLKFALNQMGIDYHDFATHDFRRCFARRAWEKWKDIQVLQRLLHHQSPVVTMRYLEQSGLQNIDYLYEMQQ